jgi:hypothetical protein
MFNLFSCLGRFCRVISFCTLALGLYVTAAPAQTFSPQPKAISSAVSNSSYPTIVDDAVGHIHIAWIDSTVGVTLASSADFGQTFLPGGIVPGSLGAAFQPQMIVDSTGKIIEIAWAKPSATSTPSNQIFDVFVSGSTDGGATFLPQSPTAVSTSVKLVSAPRLAFVGAGVDVVWGNVDTWIAQSTDGVTFSAPIKLSTAQQDSGGPRIAVDKNVNIFVAWTDRLAQDPNQPVSGNYCINPTSHIDANGNTVFDNTSGGNYYINETLSGTTPSSAATQNLSNVWKETSYPNGYFGCSYDSLQLFFDSTGTLHLLWADEQPLEDLLTTTVVPRTNAPPTSPFPIGFVGAEGVSSPSGTADHNKGIYVAWASGANAPANTEGIYFIRSDDDGANFFGGNLPEASVISAPGAISPAYPQIAVDSSGNVNIVWEQPDQPITAGSSNTFHLLFARSTDRGNTFPTIREVATQSSVLCIQATLPGNTPPNTPDTTTCGTVQMGLDANSNGDIAWVENDPTAPGSTTKIDFSMANVAIPPPDDFSISVTTPTATAFSGQTVTYNVTAAATGTFGNSAITLGCNDFPELSGTQPGTAVRRSDYTCTFTPPSGTLTAGNSATVNLTIPSNLPANTVPFAINGTSGGTTHRVMVAFTSQGSPGAPGSVQPSSAHIAVGASGTFTVQINPNAFSGNVNLLCNGQPAWIQCAFNPQSMTPSTTNNSSVLTVKVVSAPTGSLLSSPPSVRSLPGQRNGVLWSLTGTVLCLLAMALVFGGRREGRNAPILLRGFAVMALTLVLATGLISCGGGAAAPSNAATNTSSGIGTGSGTGTGSGSGSGSGGGTTPVTATFMVQTQAANGTTNLGTVSITTP